jgi:putative ABC transport system permease protein
MGIPLLKGRFLNDNDRQGGPAVLVIDEEFAKRYFADKDPIGRRIEWQIGDQQFATIVGVVGHAAHEGLDAERRIQLYFSYRQGIGRQFTFVLRTTGDPNALITAARAAVRRADPDQPIANVATMDDLVGASMGQRRLSMSLLAIFAGLAIALASLGIYGVTAQLVTQRQRELGVRMALGASTGEVMRLVLRHGMSLTLLGVVAGSVGAFGLTRLIRTQLFAVETSDPTTFVAVAALLTTVALVATVVPAWRAARLDPLRVLREE